MASIVPYRGGWRVYLYVGGGKGKGRGKRRSKTFRTQSQAKRWASEQDTAKGRLTFAAATERFLRLKLPQLDPDNQANYENPIRAYALPEIGHRMVQDLTRLDLVGVVRKVAEKGRIEVAHRLGQKIRAIFDHCVDSGDIESHPAAGLSRVLPKKRTENVPAIHPSELPELLKAIRGYPEPVTRIGLLLLAHTLVRTSELLGARWDEIKGDLWVIPKERMKGQVERRLPHVVPISPQVRKLLKELEPMTGDSPFWLASRLNPQVPISNNTLLFALYRLGYKGRMTGHGFRSVASGILNESGKFSRDAIERQLAHQETDEVRAAYNRAEYLEERKRIMAWYSSHLEML
jgi:integrase